MAGALLTANLERDEQETAMTALSRKLVLKGRGMTAKGIGSREGFKIEKYINFSINYSELLPLLHSSPNTKSPFGYKQVT